MAERLGVSRREADELIAKGKITLNGKVATLGDRITLPDQNDRGKIDNTTKVCYNDKIVPLTAEYSYLMLNKPIGYVCSRRAQGPVPTLYELLPTKYHHLKTVGRLDKDSSGLILLTNDGDFAYQMTHPKFRKTKVYEVELDKPLEPLHQQMISDFGVEIGDGISRFKILREEPEGPSLRGIRSCYEDAATSPVKTGARSVPKRMVPRVRYLVFLHEGRNRQIRRTFAALGYTVTRLHRIQFGPYELGNLKSGKIAEVGKTF